MEAPQEAGGGAPDVGAMIVETDKTLAMLAKAAQAGGMAPELAEGFAAVSAQFRTLVDQALGGGEGQPPAGPQPAAEGMAAQEAGGNPRARPMSMGG